jgi:hypothetical protein
MGIVDQAEYYDLLVNHVIASAMHSRQIMGFVFWEDTGWCDEPSCH